MREAFKVLSLAYVVLAAGCGRMQPQVSSLVHDANAPTRLEGSWQWIDISRDEYFSTIAADFNSQTSAFTRGSEQGYLKADDPLTVRTQFWLDAIHSALKSKHPDQIANVPPPKAIVKVGGPNAYVKAVPICIDLPIERTSGNGPDTDVATIFLDARHGVFIQSNAPCVSRSADSGHLDSFLNWYNQRPGTCKISKERENGQPHLVMDSSCVVLDSSYAAITSPFRARRIAISPGSTANQITFLSGLVSQHKTENHFVATLAHELGHYYRAHMVTPEDQFGFFYKRGFENPPNRPMPDPTVVAIGENFMNLLQKNKNWKPWKSVPGERVSPSIEFSMFIFASKGVQLNCHVNATCDHPCQKFMDEAGVAFRGKLKDFPAHALDSDSAGLYLQLENVFLACASDIRVVSTAADSSDGVSLNEAEMYLHVKFAEHGSPTIQTVRDAIIFASEIHDAEDAEIRLVYDKVRQMNLGQYTTEQEADELSVEFLSLLGLAPREAIEGQFDFMPSSSVTPFPDELSNDACRSLYTHQWHDERGNAVIVPVGDYTNPHHSDCFRAFDMDKEITAHHLDRPTADAPQPRGLSWAEMQNLAGNLVTVPHP